MIRIPKIAGLGRIAAPAILALMLAGCASPAPYAPRAPGQATGYTDQEITANRYRITFTGNSVTSRQTVEDYLLLRAAEVSLAAGADHFVFDTRHTQANRRVAVFENPFGYDGFYGPGFYGPGFGPGFYRPGLGGPGYWSFRPRWGYGAFGPPADVVVTTNYSAYAEIVLLQPDQVAKEPRAVDARQVVAHLGPSAQPVQAQTSVTPAS
jgi:hypothetical protein